MKKITHFRDVLLGAFFTVLVVGLTVPAFAAAVSNDDIKLVINGRTITTRDGNGNELQPVLIDGVAYIPASAVGDALGMDVSWDKNTKTIAMKPKAQTGTPDESGYIGVEAAKKAALAHAGIEASKASFFKAEIDFDDKRAAYEIEFYSGNVEYDYDIEPKTGKILSYDYEVEGYNAPVQSGTAQPAISLEQAKVLAKAKAPNATLYSCQLDNENGKQVYEGELYEGKKGYDFEIDAATGDFIKWEVDYDD